jgi:hypothetical protein
VLFRRVAEVVGPDRGEITYEDDGPRGSAVVLDGATGLRVDKARMINMPNWTASAWIKPTASMGASASCPSARPARPPRSSSPCARAG